MILKLAKISGKPGERLAASYINFYLANHCVLLPRFGDENDTVAAEILGKCFPDRRILLSMHASF